MGAMLHGAICLALVERNPAKFPVVLDGGAGPWDF